MTLNLEQRVKRDRYLISDHPRDKLRQFIESANPLGVAEAIIETLRYVTLIEEFARARGFSINEDEITHFKEEYGERLEEEVNRAITAFICSIASREG